MKHDTDRRRTRRARSAPAKTAALLLLGLALPLGALAASCATDLPPPLLDEGCTLNSDCNAPLVCAFQLCHQQCQTTRDCPSGERCIAGERPYYVCQLPSEKSCVSNTQCVMGELCAADGQCRDQCAADRDCTPGQLCVGGACAEPAEVSDAGTLVGEPGDAGVGLPCQLSSDCGDAGLVCRQGTCEVQCNQDIDCVPPQGPGGLCVAHRCEVPALPEAGVDAPADAPEDAPPDAPEDSPPDAPADAPDDAPADAPSDASTDAPDGYGQGCNLPSDCPPPLKCGNAGQCVYQCNFAIDCGAGECCVAHECATGQACIPELDGGPGDAGAGDAGPCHACIHNDDCDDTLFCNGQEQCYAGCCAPALDTPCNSHSACIEDTCIEATKTCLHGQTLGEDVDGDGYLAYGCDGGNDCDDGDPTKYLGHKEYFDGKDNDCDGLIDNWTSEVKGSTMPLGQYTLQAYTTLGAPIGGGPGGWMTVLLGNFGNTTATVYDHNWVATGQPVTGIQPYEAPWPIGAASEVGSAMFAAISAATNQLFAVVMKNDGSLASVVLLMSSIGPGDNDLADVAWGGSSYMIGWSVDFGGWQGSYALVDTSGNLLGTRTVPGMAVHPGSPVRVAGNGSTLAVAYQQPDTTVTFQLLDQSGAGIGMPIPISPGSTAPMLLALGATATGYAVLWTDHVSTYATFVPQILAQPPTTFVADPTGYPARAQGASDGAGAAFVMQYGPDVKFGYLSGSLNPFELSGPAPSKQYLAIAGGPGGRLGLFFTDTTTLYGLQAGYASLPGADCSVGSNCASGMCNVVVPSGPGAYSTCQ